MNIHCLLLQELVNFDVFSLEQNNNVKELGSWRYSIYFDYLPAYRLAVILKFPSWLGNATYFT